VAAAVAVTGLARLVEVVVAYGFEFDSERVAPKCGVAVARVLRKVLGDTDDVAASADNVVMNLIDQRPSYSPRVHADDVGMPQF
jgi:hypothetical protein